MTDDLGIAGPAAAATAVPPPSRAIGKTRNPWGVWLLGFTLVYPFIWYFKINRELRDFDSSIEVKPGRAVLAMSLGALLIVPPIVSWVRTTKRIRTAQGLAASPARCSTVLSLVITYIGFGAVSLQSQLNKVWDEFGNPAPVASNTA
jgi:hypothetical protein